MKKVAFLLACLIASGAQANIVKREYKGYSVWVDCNARSALMFTATAGVDQGNLKREDAFDFDSGLDASCQQLSRSPYSGKFPEGRYHRGHLIGVNLLDSNRVLMNETFYMTNIIPQHEVSNKGAWKETEDIQECWRGDSDAGTPATIIVMGGVTYSDPDNDHFLRTHGVRTPDHLWKILLSSNRQAAWIIPNDKTATKANLDSFLASIAEVEDHIGFKLGFDEKTVDVNYKPKPGQVRVNNFCYYNLKD